jgi:tricorn protease
MKLKVFALISFAIAAGFSPGTHAQLLPPEQTQIIGPRMPALSPNGKRIAFVYRGDIWIAPVTGGRAVQVTQHIEMDAYPLFSPCNQWIAFASKRRGNWDIFLVPATGGPTRQLTWHAGNDIPSGWSPDGKRVLFSGRRDSPNQSMFAIHVESLQTEVLLEDYATLNYPSYAPDGRSVVYGRYGFHWTRPRYHGSAAAQIWTFHLESGLRQAITSNHHQHLWTQFFPDGQAVLTVTYAEQTPSVTNVNEVLPKLTDNALRTPNLWKFTLAGQGTQLTTFTGGSVRWPSIASETGDVAFEYGPDLWLLKHGAEEPVKLAFYGAEDEKENRRRYEKLTTGATELEPSPDGKTVAFGLRGEIWTVPVERPKGVAGRSAEFARRLTDWAGDDSDFSWSPDGKKLYFLSDRQFTTGLLELDIESGETKTLWQRGEDVSHLRLSPDGKQLAFWVAGGEGGLFLFSLEKSEARRLVHVPGPHARGAGGGAIEWSPDTRWIAFTRANENRSWNIWIAGVEGGEPVNITRLNASHGQPTWSPDGKYLFFQSNRDGDGLYVVSLVPEEARSIDVDIKFEKPKDDVTVEIDFTNISRRIRKLSSQNPTADLTVSSEGLILFRSGNDIWSCSYDGKETKRLTTGTTNSNARVTGDGKKVFFVRSGELWSMKPDGGGQEKLSFSADWERDVRAERLAAFTQFWRSYQRGFYDSNFHGRDWESIRRGYEPLLEAVQTTDEFASLLHMMVGELEASHAEVTPASGDLPKPVTPHLGFSFDYSHDGPGIRVKMVPSGAPGFYAKTQIKPGEYILAINGRDVSLDEALYEWINNKQDREFEFLVHDRPEKEGARTVRYKVLSQDEWNNLIYQNRTDRLRELVESRSAGKIGYLHIARMAAGNQTVFEREAYEYVLGKEALIIDVRFNSGGNISDTLIDWLSRAPHGYFRPRDVPAMPAPHRAWDKPMIVIMNEHSYSNAEMFPAAMRQRGLAQLVGMPTPGYVIWTYALRLVDGTGARMPASGVFRLDGSPQENLGEKPDVQVWMTPEDWLAERDPQLEKAIELLHPGNVIADRQDSPREKDASN